MERSTGLIGQLEKERDAARSDMKSTSKRLHELSKQMQNQVALE